jgi:GST-like protein
VNSHTPGLTHQKDLPVSGKHPLQIYSYATPNGVKVMIMLEELIMPGITSVSKIPTMMDHAPLTTTDDDNDDDDAKK